MTPLEFCPSTCRTLKPFLDPTLHEGDRARSGNGPTELSNRTKHSSELTVSPTWEPCLRYICPVVSGSVHAAVERVKPEKAQGGSEAILLVEGEPAFRKATAEFLSLQGSTLDAKDGLGALCVTRNHGSVIDLVITDVDRPNMSDGQLAKELATLCGHVRDSRSFPGMPEKPCSTRKYSTWRRISCRNPTR
jgi:hypothetical protein